MEIYEQYTEYKNLSDLDRIKRRQKCKSISLEIKIQAFEAVISWEKKCGGMHGFFEFFAGQIEKNQTLIYTKHRLKSLNIACDILNKTLSI